MSSHLEMFITQWDLCTCMERHNNTSCTILFATARASGISVIRPHKQECFNLTVYWSKGFLLPTWANLLMFRLNAPVIIRAKVSIQSKCRIQSKIGKLFSKLKLVINNLASFMRKPTEKPLKVESVLFTSMPTLLLGGTRHAPIMLE